ncbi:MAG: glycosyl transferase [Gammaproteobacteria bacterium CG22_combo_CG10-13_8_21_14_all_40_8]|nr:MAG: glycosyl transferase [Gammaproteobacteria bacterium CG22_combo_CG10-13_8_21_14_all_40_8]
MKILYAVQATGNGHINRARNMAQAFKALNIEVEWLFSGRPKQELFDMEIFGKFQCYAGLTFAIKNGRVDYLKTIFINNFYVFIKDIFSLNVKKYDLIINDFEPVSAWSCYFKKVKTIGLSNQMALKRELSSQTKFSISKIILNYFAPVTDMIGFHWIHHDYAYLPPMIDNHLERKIELPRKILVYYPYAPIKELIDWLAPFKEFEFHIFQGKEIATGFPNIFIHSFSKSQFNRIQQSCEGIITAAGFELASEAIHLGLKLLIFPLSLQMEQQYNANILKKLGHAKIIHNFSKESLQQWLKQPLKQAKPYNQTAYELVKWLVKSEKESLKSLSKKLWKDNISIT